MPAARPPLRATCARAFILLLVCGVAAIVRPVPAHASFSLQPPTCQQVSHNSAINCVLARTTLYTDGMDHPFGDPVAKDIPLVTGADGISRGDLTFTIPNQAGAGGDCEFDDSNVVWSWTNPPCLWGRELISIHRYDPLSTQAPLDSTGFTITQVDADAVKPAFHTLRVQVQLPAVEIDADRYYMLGAYDTIGTAFRQPPNMLRYDIVLHLPKQSIGKPKVSCTATPVPGPNGSYRLESTSTDPGGTDPIAEWTFPDGSTGTGNVAYHTFSEAGSESVQLKVTGAEATSTGTCLVDVPAPRLAVDISTPGQSPPYDTGAPLTARVRVSASGNSPGTIAFIRFPNGLITASGTDVSFSQDAPSPDLAQFSLASGEHRDFTVVLHPTGVGKFTLATTVAGQAQLRVFTGQMGFSAVNAAGDLKGAVGSALKVEVTLNPASVPEQPEDATGPTPVDVNVHVRVTNQSGGLMTGVKLLELTRAARVHGATVLVNRVGPDDIGNSGFALGDLADGAYAEYDATYRASDDAEVTFDALASGVRASLANDYGTGRANWSVKPKYLLKVTTHQDKPTPGSAIPAGDPISISGTVTNLSRSESEKVGPVYPELGGAAGVESLAWDTSGTDPNDFVPSGTITLGPGESRDFTVRVTTAWSDPTQSGMPHRTNSGGTRADLTFTPWAKVTDEDGVEHDVDPAQVEADPAQLTYHVPVDDSVEIPQLNWAAYAGAFTYGGILGVRNAASSLLRAPLDLVNFTASSLHAIANYQYQVWDSFTPAERLQFEHDTAALAVAILQRNVTKAALTPDELFQQADAAVATRMTELENKWQVGDYTETVQAWSEGGADAVSQIVLPIAAAKLARSSAAVRALGRAQAALQTTFESSIGVQLADIRRVEELGPLLEAIASGTELAPGELERLYGISPTELAELQKLADKYDLLLTVRSRHASSIRWIEDFGAMLKPERLKVKTVSEIDARLGYRPSDVGSLVFKKPVPLQRFEAAGAGADLGQITDQYLTEQGFDLASSDAVTARARLKLRAEEWKEWEKSYKQWGKLKPDGTGEGFLDVSYNYKGNAIDDTVRTGTGKYVGFRMRPIPGETDAFVMQMFDARTGKWVPITGDIDPIAFTHLDGSPLDMEEHADLVDAIAKNPFLRGQHAESATFVGVGDVHDGVKFVSKQFKLQADGRYEAGLQIAPGNVPPRVVRLDPKRSFWNSPFDYRLQWDGGYVYTGAYRPRAPGPVPGPNWGLVGAAGYDNAPAAAAHSLPQSVAGDPSLGRCIIHYSNATTAHPYVLTADADVVQVGAGGATTPTDVAGACLTEGPVLTLDVRAGTGLTANVDAGSTRVPVGDGPTDGTQGTQFQPGQVVLVGAGTDHGEQATIVGFGSLIFQHPLQFAHAADEAIVVVRSAPAHFPTIVSRARPQIVGAALVGHTVRATPGTWDVTPTSVDYQWLAGNKPISGATTASLKLTAKLAGKQLSVVVTAHAVLRSPLARGSLYASVKYASTARVALAGRRVTVRVATAATRAPTGTVTIMVGHTRIRVSLRAAAHGRVTVTLGHLRPGTYTVTAVYSGTRRIAAATSAPATLHIS